MPHNRFRYMTPFNGLSKDEFLSLTKSAAVNYVIKDDGKTAVLDIDGYIGRDLFREWMTGEKSENTVKNIKGVLREINTEKIIVNINSPGGDLNDGLVIMNMLQSKNAEIITNVMGFSASAATVIAQAGSTRRMSQESFQLLHRVMFGVMGYINQNTTRDLTADMEVIDGQLIKMYERVSTTSADDIAKLMDEGGGYGKWIDADTALEMGLIDEVYDAADEGDENIDHLEAKDAQARMKNIQKLATSGAGNNQAGNATATIEIDGDKLAEIVDDAIENFKKEHETNSGSADARMRNKRERDTDLFELEQKRKVK